MIARSRPTKLRRFRFTVLGRPSTYRAAFEFTTTRDAETKAEAVESVQASGEILSVVEIPIHEFDGFRSYQGRLYCAFHVAKTTPFRRAYLELPDESEVLITEVGVPSCAICWQYSPTRLAARDTQRSKLYSAQGVIAPGRVLGIEDATRFVNYIASRPEFFQAFGRVRPISVRRLHRNSKLWAGVAYRRTMEIHIDRGLATERTLVHELAHLVTADEVASHGREYAGNFIAIVAIAFGTQAAETLRRSFDAARVRYTRDDLARGAAEAKP